MVSAHEEVFHTDAGINHRDTEEGFIFSSIGRSAFAHSTSLRAIAGQVPIDEKNLCQVHRNSLVNGSREDPWGREPYES